jgi:drug/metabolite transporter (DMT)-like permease
MWLFGSAAQGAAFVFQALALHNGLVSVVQPLLVTELVLALVLRRLWLRQSILLITWMGAVLACAGLAVFIVAGDPPNALVPAAAAAAFAVMCAGVVVLTQTAPATMEADIRSDSPAQAGDLQPLD